MSNSRGIKETLSKMIDEAGYALKQEKDGNRQKIDGSFREGVLFGICVIYEALERSTNIDPRVKKVFEEFKVRGYVK